MKERVSTNKRIVEWLKKLFEGRINRSNYAYYIFILVIILALWILLTGELIQKLPATISIVLSYLLTTPLYILTVFFYSLSVRRLHDMGWSGWWSLLFFMPLGNLVLVFILLLSPGEGKENEYGYPPSEETMSIKQILGFSPPLSPKDQDDYPIGNSNKAFDDYQLRQKDGKIIIYVVYVEKFVMTGLGILLSLIIWWNIPWWHIPVDGLIILFLKFMGIIITAYFMIKKVLFFVFKQPLLEIDTKRGVMASIIDHVQFNIGDIKDVKGSQELSQEGGKEVMSYKLNFVLKDREETLAPAFNSFKKLREIAEIIMKAVKINAGIIVSSSRDSNIASDGKSD